MKSLILGLCKVDEVFCFWVNSDSIKMLVHIISSKRTTVMDRDICLFTRVVVVLNMRKVPPVFFQPPLACFLYAALGVIVKAGTLYLSTVMSLRHCWYSKSPFPISLARPSQEHVTVFFYNTIPNAGAKCEWILAIIYAPQPPRRSVYQLFSASAKRLRKEQNCVHCNKSRNIWILFDPNSFL